MIIMKEYIENKWEDSYQKRERLMNELKDEFENLKQAFETSKKDIDLGNESIKKIDELKKKLNDLNSSELKLLNDDKDITQKYKEISGKEMTKETEDELDRIIEETADNQTKLNYVRNQILETFDDTDKIFEEIIGTEGDISGSKAIVESKIRRIQEIQKQISERDNDSY